MTSTALGILTLLNPQPLNAPSPILVSRDLDLKLSDSRAAQPSKQYDPMKVTDFGMASRAIGQCEKAEFSILVSLDLHWKHNDRSNSQA
jgi:hypothetical protein